jgi:ABC-type multidrug transport system fused ATPase/permease subunit
VNKSAAAGTLVKAEDIDTGGLSWRVYKSYIGAMGGFPVALFLLLLFFLAQVTFLVSSWWLSAWSQNAFRQSQTWYLGLYAMLIGVLIIITSLRGLLSGSLLLRAARYLHDSVFAMVLRAPLNFFDSTPVGRILNRFSKDQENIDDLLPESLANFAQYVLMVLGSLGLVTSQIPYFALSLIPIAIIYFAISVFYRKTSRELQRINGVCRSPLVTHMSVTLQGLSSLRAYKAQDRFIHAMEQHTDLSNTAQFNFVILGRWLAFRLDLMSAVIGGATVIVAVLVDVDASKAGLVVSTCLAVPGIFQWMLRSMVETEAWMTSVERQVYYLYNLPQEPPRQIAATKPPADWPSQGAVSFENVTMRYRADLPPCLMDVSFSVQPKEKVGIVGRTGAGKSTVSLTLFHLIQRDAGKVMIDGVDAFSIGLEDLRTKLAVIPQDPVLFLGDISFNLDPFKRSTETELIEVIDRVGLKDWLATIPAGLKMLVQENGENLSVGQRQLLCIARALLRKSKILFLDEATASVDVETDALVQAALKTAFGGCTVFAIAHRLNTIIDSDKVLVLDGGRKKEFDVPATLLENPQSAFYALVNDTGERMARNLTSRALSKRNSRSGSLAGDIAPASPAPPPNPALPINRASSLVAMSPQPDEAGGRKLKERID